MIRQTKKLRSDRRGAILVLAAVMVAVLLGIVAFAVDYGHLLKVRTDLQRTADASALAAVQDLITQGGWNPRRERGPGNGPHVCRQQCEQHFVPSS